MSVRYKETQYGFEYGAASVERCCSDEKKGWVVLVVRTKLHPHGLNIYVTKSGKIRVHAHTRKSGRRIGPKVEWKEPVV